MKLRLQIYDDGTFGYLGYDGNEISNLTTNARVVATQEEDESREEFIQKNNITFSPNQYGSIEAYDANILNSTDLYDLVRKNYAIDKIYQHADTESLFDLARFGYLTDKLIYSDNLDVRSRAICAAAENNKTELLKDLVKFDLSYITCDHKYENILGIVIRTGYYNKEWFNGISEPWIIEDILHELYIVDKLNEPSEVTDILYNKCMAGDAPTADTIIDLAKLGYDFSTFEHHEDPRVRYALCNNNNIDEFVDDKSSTIREKVYSAWLELSDEDKTDFISRHIKKIIKRESSYLKIVEYAIDHDMFTKYILEHTRSDEFKNKIIFGNDFVSGYVDVNKLKKYHLNSKVAHMPPYPGSQGHFSISIRSLKKDKLVLANTLDSSPERIAVDGPKIRGDDNIGCRDGIYYKCLVSPDTSTFDVDLSANQSVYVHESVFTRHSIYTVKKGLFEEE